VALVYQYRAADKTRAIKYMGDLSPADMARLESALRQYLGL
jgi:mRNA-degrading endonuclease toxin of MazEF toxin-antitoxin module